MPPHPHVLRGENSPVRFKFLKIQIEIKNFKFSNFKIGSDRIRKRDRIEPNRLKKKQE